jgi:hypothetical protein
MNGGQLMAGVGQCQRIGSWHTPRPGAYTTGAAPIFRYHGGPNY